MALDNITHGPRNLSNISLNTTGNITLPGNFTISWPPSEEFQIAIFSTIIVILLAVMIFVLWRRRHKSSAKAKRYIRAGTPQMWLPESDDVMLNKLKEAERSLVRIADTVHSEFADKDNWQQRYITARLESFLRDTEKKK